MMAMLTVSALLLAFTVGFLGAQEITRQRRWERWALSKIVLRRCDIPGCERIPQFRIDADTYVCGAHL